MADGRRISLLLLMFAMPAARGETPGAYLGELSWPVAEQKIAAAPLVIVPFAAGAKEHGPHLPMNADQAVAEYLLGAAVASLPVVVVPPVLHGWFPAFRDFPGTEVADASVFEAYMFEIGMSLVRHGARRLVFLNTGIANATGLPIAIAAREIRAQTGVPTLVVSWGDLETEESALLAEQQEGGHADEIETSINLYLQPELVRMDLAVRDYGERPRQEQTGYAPGSLSRDPDDPAHSASGIYGDATLASADKGQRALEIMAGEWLKALQQFSRVPLKKTD